MNAEQLLQHFERISEAPHAIKRLRRFILDLAVRGKLVEQDPSDEPASELLKRIATEKARLVKAGKARKLEVDPVTNEEISSPVPSNWVCTRLGSIGDWGSGSTPSRGNSDLYDGGITWLKSGELNDNRALEGSEETVSKLAVEKGSFRINKTGDVLIAMYGATIGKVAILAESAVTNQAICGCTPFPGVFNQYLFFYLLSQRAKFHSASEGGAQPNISKVKIVWTTFFLPPLAEQHRIVARVDELMALCDQLEAAKAEREKCRDSLVAASLQGLNQLAEEKGTFREHARFTFNNLPQITTRASHIKQLRQSILNLAVRGKLVEQRIIDGSAIDELNSITEQRGTSKKGRRSSKVTNEGEALNTIKKAVPSSWFCAYLGDIVDPLKTISYGVLVPGDNMPGGVPLVRAQDLCLSGHPQKPNKCIAPDVERAYARTRLEGGEILLCVVGSIGKIGIAPSEWAGANIARAVARIKPIPQVYRDYLLLFLQSQNAQSSFKDSTRTLAQPTLNIGLIEQTPIPLPPLAEQKRIVAKVDELMAICNQLEMQITATEQDFRRFLESVLADVLAPSIDLKEVAEVA